MARQLWLLRHAEAERHGTRADFERRLTERGEEQARAAGRAIASLQSRFDAVLFSPKVRARRTAELATEQWPEQQRARLQAHEPLTEGFDVAAAYAALGSDPDAHLLLIGHEPDLSGVIAALTGARVDLKKGGLALVRLEGSEASDGPASAPGHLAFGAELVLLMRPRELALVAQGSRLGSADVVSFVSGPAGGDG